MDVPPLSKPNRLTTVAGAAVLLLVLAAVVRLVLSTAMTPPSPDARARAIGERLACPVCQGESVADSQAAQAQQMRDVIRRQIADGRSDQQIEQYFVDRYGESILLAPPRRGFASLLWWFPPLATLAGLATVALAAYRFARSRSDEASLPDLSPEETRRYAAQLEAHLREDAVDERSGREADRRAEPT